MNINKKTAIVTGSAKGIGKELIIEFSKLGYNVVIVYNSSKKDALYLKNEIQNKFKNEVLCVKCDITNEEAIKKLKEEIVDKFKSINILVNNAAYCNDNYIDDKSKEEFMKVLEVNTCGTFLVTKHLYKYITDTIVNVSSTDAVDTYNSISMDYAASKAAINSLTKTFALAFKNLKVIGVMPNWTNTESVKEMNPVFLKNELERIGQKKLEEPNEVAKNIISLINNKNIKSGSIERV